MARTLHISYDELGAKLGHVTFLVDDQIVCKLRNHERFDAEISEFEHKVNVKIGFLPVFKGTITAGSNNWSLSYEQKGTNVRNACPGKFVLFESKPFYGKSL